MKTTSSSSSRLIAYGSFALGATAVVSTNADAATVVDANSNTYATGFSGIGTAGFSQNSYEGVFSKSYLNFSGGSGVSIPQGNAFRRGGDADAISFSASTFSFRYASNSSPESGAALNSSDNWFYAVAANDAAQRVWLQLSFGAGGSSGTGFSIMKAVIPGFSGELPNAAAASAVPEPSALVLLSLGASGLMIRRRRAA